MLGGEGAGQLNRRGRIAIVWAGSATHGNDHNRSLPNVMLETLLGGVDVDWLSLQMGDRRADLHRLPDSVRSRVADASDALTDFNDTAHLLASCDMLVSVDTSVVHLAGALGVRLSGPRIYGARRVDEPWVNGACRDPGAADLAAALALYRRAMAATAAGLALAALA